MSVILIIADRAHDRQIAIARGMVLGQKLGFAVQVVGFCYEALAPMGISEPKMQAEARKKLLARRKTEVEAEVRKNNRTGMRVATTVIWQKDIHHWIIRQCSRKSYAAVIKTGSGTDSFLNTSTDWHLLRECQAPVMIVAEKKWRSATPIVAAIDVSSKLRVKQRLNREVIATAKQYSDALGCPLYLVHALHIPAILSELDLVDEQEQSNKMKKELEPRLIRLSKDHGIPLKQFRLKQGPVDKVITSEAARLKAQLLVMGTVGRKGVRAKLMGNTAESVLQKLRTDVLALKP